MAKASTINKRIMAKKEESIEKIEKVEEKETKKGKNTMEGQTEIVAEPAKKTRKAAFVGTVKATKKV